MDDDDDDDDDDGQKLLNKVVTVMDMTFSAIDGRLGNNEKCGCCV